MSRYAAQIKNGVVTQAIVGIPEWAADRLGGEWHGTDSKVGIGWTYTDTDGFRPPQPYPSWTWDGTGWQPPVPYPDDENEYQWDEEDLSWATILPSSDEGDS